ncbi:hypothetical protein GF312_08465 [Candidatus Poribacteria bacterium]|nr:hypothetical protein [Candidatus Poribacteria bacterium]
MNITFQKIRNGLKKFDIAKGDRIMVHSSLSSFGWVEGGAETVIRALMDIVGEDGIILMPSFNHGVPFNKRNPDVYDPLKTPCTNGLIPDTFWRMDDVYRSLNPTHPFAAWGKDAERYTKNHHNTLTMGEDSPLGMIARDGGYELNLGTNHHTTTAKHVAETMNRVSCLGYRTEQYPVKLTSGNKAYHRTWGWREYPCPLTESGEYIEAEMERQSLQEKLYVGKSLVTHFRLLDLLKVVLELLDNGYDDKKPCWTCPIKPRITGNTVPSDWPDPVDYKPRDLIGK